VARQHLTRFILNPEDEGMHPDEGKSNFNESVYFNLLDHAQRMGGWFRIGNRPNEKYAEMSCCLYLPDGRVGSMHSKPEIDANQVFDAGGLRCEMLEPYRRQRLQYRGDVCLMENPADMADPSRAFRENPLVSAEVMLDFDGVSPMHGGLRVMADGSPLPDIGFAKGHYEQHIAGRGYIRVGEQHWDLSGFGLRDHSWGPRNWSSIPWYRWLPLSFGEDFAMMVSLVCFPSGLVIPAGMVLRDGVYHDIEAARIEPVWDSNHYQTELSVWLRTEDGEEYELDGKVLSLIPLRHRRTDKDGNVWLTRITEGFTEYRCNGRTGYGISEFLDQIDEDGVPQGFRKK